MLEHVFKEISIGSLKLKNRFVVPPMVSNMSTRDGVATPQYADYLEARAKGGFGLIITENFGVNENARAFPFNGGLWNKEQEEALVPAVKRVHAAGGKIAAQLYHAGRESSSDVTGINNVAPSPFQDPTIPEQPKELTTDDIHNIVEDFKNAACRAKEAGFDAVEIHCAHGYLIDQFLSPFSNKRTDEYGGTILNRARFMLEIIKAVREAVEPELPVFCRLSADELVDGGLTIQDMRVFCMLMQEAGIAALDVSFGVFASGGHIAASYYEEHGCRTNLAAMIKSISSVPVIAVGRINDPLFADAIIASGEADLIAMGRASLADPEMPNKARNGHLEDIFHCVGCRQGCNGNMGAQKPIGCLVNPHTGNETVKGNDVVRNAFKVLVAGGGLAGMEFAVTAASRGAQVTLAEKTDRLGGQWLLALVPPHKQEYANLIIQLKQQLAESGVKMEFGREVKEADTKEYDFVIDATGAEQLLPDIRIETKARVLLEKEVLSGKAQVRGKVYVCDFGSCASNVAAFLAAQGKDVTLLMKKDVYDKYGDGSLSDALKNELKQAGVRVIRNCPVDKIGAEIETPEGNITLTEEDDIVLCTKYSNRAQRMTESEKLIRIGDAKKIGNALEAMQQGYLEACKL